MPPEGQKETVAREEVFAPERLLEALTKVTDEVFATMLSGVSKLSSNDDLEGQTVDRVSVEASIDFSGDQGGTVVLRCTADGALDITRGLLMLDDQEPIELEEIQDAVGECANMVGGSLKTQVLDPVGSFTLGLPKIETYAKGEEHQRCGSLVYELTDGHAVVEIWLEPPADAA